MSAGIKRGAEKSLTPCDRLLLRMTQNTEKLLALRPEHKPAHVARVRKAASGLMREANRRLRAVARAQELEFEGHPLYAAWLEETRLGDTRLPFVGWMQNRTDQGLLEEVL